MGRFHFAQPQDAAGDAINLDQENDRALDGSVAGATWGTLVHGLWDQPHFTRHVLTQLAIRFSLDFDPSITIPTREDEYDRIADHLEEHLDIDAMLGL